MGRNLRKMRSLAEHCAVMLILLPGTQEAGATFLSLHLPSSRDALQSSNVLISSRGFRLYDLTHHQEIDENTSAAVGVSQLKAVICFGGLSGPRPPTSPDPLGPSLWCLCGPACGGAGDSASQAGRSEVTLSENVFTVHVCGRGSPEPRRSALMVRSRSAESR